MGADTRWPATADELEAVQRVLAEAAPPRWVPPDRPPVIAGCFACFGRGYRGPGEAGEHGWAAAAAFRHKKRVTSATITGRSGGPYVPGLLALRSGALLDDATRSLSERPDVLIVDATGYDHPRRAGLALHLGAVLDMPTSGSRTARSSRSGSGRLARPAPRARCGSTMCWSVIGYGHGTAGGRSRYMRVGVPIRTLPGESC